VPGAFGKLAERVSGREAGAVDEAARQDKLAVAQPQRRLGALDRLCQTTRQNPFQIHLGGVRRAGIGWNPPSVACLHTFQHALALLRREQIEQGLPVSWYKGLSNSVYIGEIRHKQERLQGSTKGYRDCQLMLTARAETFLHGHPNLDETIRRLQSFAEAGADVLYAPGLPRLEAIRERFCVSFQVRQRRHGLEGRYLFI
jgi:hypothetical protein